MKIYKFKMIESDEVVLLIEASGEHLAFMTLEVIVANINDWKLI